MAEAGLEPGVRFELLQKRDGLLRALARDSQHSLKAVASFLRGASADLYDLEVALVAAMRALGFYASHVSGAGEPDGVGVGPEVAQPVDEEEEEVTSAAVHFARFDAFVFTIEAKSSKKVPDLGNLDFGGLHSHQVAAGATATMLVAPSYPGGTVPEDNSQAAQRARNLGVSCWTIESLARVVEAAEARHVTTAEVSSIVRECRTPKQVEAAVDRLLSQTPWSQPDLYRAILRAIRQMDGRLRDRKRSISMIETALTFDADFTHAAVTGEAIAAALRVLAKTSRGMLHVTSDEVVVIRGSLDELERRVSSLTGADAASRRRGLFVAGEE